MRALHLYKNTNWLKDETCPICDSEDIKQFDQVASAPYAVTHVDELQFLMAVISNYNVCNHCKTIFQNPHMSEEDIVKFYKSGLYRSSLGLSKGLVLVDEEKRANAITDFIIQAGIEPKTHLDIGASFGILVKMMGEKLGTEGRGYDLYGEYRDGNQEKADLITSLHVLEHCFDPAKELLKYRDLTKKWMVLEVPRQTEFKDKRGLRFSHLYSFPKEIVEKLVEEAGFKILISEQKPDTRILAKVI